MTGEPPADGSEARVRAEVTPSRKTTAQAGPYPPKSKTEAEASGQQINAKRKSTSNDPKPRSLPSYRVLMIP